jgi:hypothetical protein
MRRDRSDGAADFFEPVPGWRIWRRSARRQLESFEPAPRRLQASNVSDAAPDYLEPVIGWRVWRLVKFRRRYLLGSLFNNIAWFPGAALDAHCLQEAPRSRRHAAPDEKCYCGIYASRHEAIDWAAVSGRSLSPLVLGRVLLWGSVIEAELGWRAAHAYPERIFVPRVHGRALRGEDDLVVDSLAAYGVPVEPVAVASQESLLPTVRVLAQEA